MPPNSDTNHDLIWKKIDSLDKRGLPQSAKKLVDSLTFIVEREGDIPQQVKCLFYQTKYIKMLEEGGLEKAILHWQAALDRSTYPLKPIIQSILGESYFRYLDFNYWKLEDRTATSEGIPADFLTWTPQNLLSEGKRLLLESVSDERTQEFPLSTFSAILKKDGTSQDIVWPTLYDFLAHRCLEILEDDHSTVSLPQDVYYLDDPAAFLTTQAFVNHTFKTTDNNSSSFQALLLWQQLLAFRLNDTNPAALLDADYKRLRFVYEKAIIPQKDSLFEEALQKLVAQFPQQDEVAELYWQIAVLKKTRGDTYDLYATDKTGQWLYKEVDSLCKWVMMRYPNTRGASLCHNLSDQFHQKTIDILTPEVNVPGAPILSQIQYKNIHSAHFKLYKMDADVRMRIENMPATQARVQYILQLEPLREWETALPDPGDMRTHFVEQKIEALPIGDYLLLTSDSKEPVPNQDQLAWVRMHVSNLGYWSRSEPDGSTAFYLVNRQNGAPVADATVEVFKRTNVRSYEEGRLPEQVFQTDEAGYIRIKGAKRDPFQVSFQKGKDQLFLPATFYNYSFGNRGTSRMIRHTAFFTDRSIYRPGQRVFFKAVLMEKDSNSIPQIVPDTEVEISFLDVNYQQVAKLKLKSNRFGTINGSFEIPVSVLTGQMSLQCNFSRDRHYFQVEAYKRPRFEINFDPVESTYVLGDAIEVPGKASFFAGFGVDGATVNYRVVRETRFPYWYRWWIPPVSREQAEIAHGKTTTDTKGNFFIPFSLHPDPTVPASQNPVFRYAIYADVTDKSGESHSAETTIFAGYTGLQVNIPVSREMNRVALDSLSIEVTNLGGNPVDAAIDLTIEKLSPPSEYLRDRLWARPDQYLLDKEAFQKLFPHDPWDQEDLPSEWPVEKGMLQTSLQVNGKDRLPLQAAEWPSGHYRLKVKATDAAGKDLELEHYFSLYVEGESLPYGNIQHVLPGKKEWQPGETATFLVQSTERSGHVLVEWEHRNRVVKREWIETKKPVTLSFPLDESHRGGLYCHFRSMQHERAFSEVVKVPVPWTNKELTLTLSTFRNQLQPGQQEEWKLTVRGPEKERVAAELAATLYDASLDAFKPHNWNLTIYPQASTSRSLNPNGVGLGQHIYFPGLRTKLLPVASRTYPELNWFGFELQPAIIAMYKRDFSPADAPAMERANQPEVAMAENMAQFDAENEALLPPESVQRSEKIPVRKNLDELVFFFPDLQTDREGNIVLSFTMNEALTSWKFLAFALTESLQTGFLEEQVVTRKEVMVLPNVPRFLREGDEVELTARVNNLTDSPLEGVARIELLDAITLESVSDRFNLSQVTSRFEIEATGSQTVSWKVQVPENFASALTYRVYADAGSFSDGEENTIPVITNRVLVTETMPLPIGANEHKTFIFSSMEKWKKSPSLQSYSYALEFTSNPLWYAIQALPYLADKPGENIDQIFYRYYVNALSAFILNENPEIKRVFEAWKIQAETEGSNAFQSNLEKNSELKSALLAETPWVLESQKESNQKKEIALLFDANRLARAHDEVIKLLYDRQLSNGAFSWFPGGRENWYITQYILEGLGHLNKLTGKKSDETDEEEGIMTIQAAALSYIDKKIQEHYDKLVKRLSNSNGNLDDDHLDQLAIHYLYTRSFYQDIPFPSKKNTAFAYYLGQAEKYILNKSLYNQGLLTLVLHRYQKREQALAMIRSFRERAIQNPELGMYWKSPTGYYWHQRPIETQALLIEVFQEIAPDKEILDKMRVWLLKNKQTNHWQTTKATAAAIYGLIAGNEKSLKNSVPVEISLGGQQVEVPKREVQAGTGYFKKTYSQSAITPQFEQIQVHNPNPHISWGAAYWQYFENLDEVTSFEDTPLQLRKKLFRKTNTVRGPVMDLIKEGESLKKGDQVIVQLEVRTDRPMDFVHLKDMRGSGLEPAHVLSTYRWQGGLGYYESTRDLATHFYFDQLPPGTWILEYPLVATQTGIFSNGISTLQCLYAPEFSAHSEGRTLTIE